MFNSNYKCYRFFNFLTLGFYTLIISSWLMFYYTSDYMFIASFGLFFGIFAICEFYENKYFNKTYQFKSNAKTLFKKETKKCDSNTIK